MNTPKTGMRTVLAAAAAGALVLGSAAGVSAHPKTPSPAKGPKVASVQAKDRLQSVSLKNHRTIDLAKDNSAKTLTLRAKVWDPDRNSQTREISMALGVYTKKVNGSLFKIGDLDAPLSKSVELVMKQSDAKKKVKRYSLTAKVVGDLWEAAELGALAGELGKGERAYICIAEATANPVVDRFSVQVAKRLGEKVDGTPVKRPVRDCVRVIDSSVPAPAPTS